MNSKEINLKGSLGHDKEDIQKSLNLVKKKGFDLSFFISEEVKLEDLQETFKNMINPKERRYIKKVIKI
ncbi:MAG: hypothetical protein P8Y97_05235 [Candidatus Lokiarchaeota archaeon]